MIFDVVIIGGGAAGLFCAIEAARRGRKTLVLEHNPQVGKKILVSGGGRCNFTNLGTTHENFISENPHFCKSALARFTPEDFIRLVRKHRIEYYEKKLGQLFCRESSRRIVEMLLAECSRAEVEIRTACTVLSLKQIEGAFEIETKEGPVKTKAVVIATGGLSYPKIGATDFGYGIAKQFGIERTPTRPSLVALVTENGPDGAKLAGVSLDAEVAAGGKSFRENILFTHRGLSGPAILQISNYWERSEPVSIDLVPERDIGEALKENRHRAQKVVNFLSEHLPQRFAERFVPEATGNRPLNKMADREIENLASAIHSWKVKFGETEGYGRAEVTLGGVSTRELSSQTMESKKVPGLYFIGEVVDVTGWLGGYNFQWAWASGHAAGTAV